MFFPAEGFTFRNFLVDVLAIFMFVVWFWLLIMVFSSTASQPEMRVPAESVCTIGASWKHPCDRDEQPMMECSDRVGNVTLGSDRRRREVGN